DAAGDLIQGSLRTTSGLSVIAIHKRSRKEMSPERYEAGHRNLTVWISTTCFPESCLPVSTPSIPAELLQEYPFAPKSIDLGGHRYSYVDEGTGPTVLFVHGNPTWSFAWRNLIKGLLPDYRCLAVDHLGM